MKRDLDIARTIQRGLLPTDSPRVEGFEIVGWSQAAEETGGDYFDWLELPDGRVIVTLADVTGHGIGPAMIAAASRAYVRASTGSGDIQLVNALRHVNALLHADTQAARFVTAAVALIDPSRSIMTFFSAGQAPILFFEARTAQLQVWRADYPPLAVTDGLAFPEPRLVTWRPGDVLVLATDGFFEWANKEGEQYGVERLRAFVERSTALEPAVLIRTLYEDVLTHAGGTVQADDLTAVVIRKL